MKSGSIAPQVIHAVSAGGRFDSSQVPAPPLSAVEQAAGELNLQVKVKSRADGIISIAAQDLSWDTELETRHGTMTVRDALATEEFLASGKLRCQTPFRDSDSEAAFLGRCKDGRPFVHDTGTATTHWLRDEDWQPSQASPVDGEIKPVELLFNVNAYRAARFFDANPPTLRWLLDDFLPAGIVGIVVAPGGTGKSWFFIQMASSVVTGLPLAGQWKVGLTGSVILLSAEDGEEQLHRRFERLLNQPVFTTNSDLISQLRERLIVVPRVGEDNLLTATDPHTREVGMTLLVDRLIVTAQQIHDLALIIIDPASRFRGGDENSAEDTTRFVQALERLAQTTGATVLVAHHSNKGAFNSTEQNQSASRGSSALTDGVRWQLNLMTFSEKEARRFGIPPEQRNFYVTAALTKSNYSPPHAPVILRRGDGGYLHRVNLVSHKEAQGDDLKSRIVALVASELKAGRQFSKTGFAQQFGKKDGALQAGNNTVREVLGNLIDTGRLRIEQGKLALPKKAKISITHAPCDITMNRDEKGSS